ncbi:DUF2178 domain-containing protein [Halarchaeum nitratireducens]|uniref:DUF2178 domain-containing protein n=1 Tax=Halarchaeum nitratireducens TaxID=489913 RepID=A0A830GDJ4_9EURY|nr:MULTISPECIES: DUF2178 domain-containing protein [Halarchaeum]MBP2250965.1 Na+/melibiose symporter-like transporter [Halarchaeum solikamskense]GGN21398.1 hypothetical protein GCM10009021_23300 [Halarchaeum nitratireducens]
MGSKRSGPALTRRTYRRLVYGIIAVGVIGLLAGIVLDERLLGTVVYLCGAWLGAGIAFLAPWWSDTTLQDERDYDLHNRASGLTMGIATILGISIIPALYVLDAGGYVEISGAIGGAIAVLSALFLLYGVCFAIVQRSA